ncbi:MAG TPA: TraR/DksA C4-type zinc finger protein [Acidimicrobiales bacterium]|nr:TraR/DksA C4-type zinc finger protein [Acidimicrobiales bacterium]
MPAVLGAHPSRALERALRRARADVVDLQRQLAAVAESTQQVPDDEHDAEGATIGYERARLRALVAHTEREVGDLEAAVARAAGGDYGRCLACGRPIAPERLAALPATPVCLPCAARPDRR